MFFIQKAAEKVLVNKDTAVMSLEKIIKGLIKNSYGSSNPSAFLTSDSGMIASLYSLLAMSAVVIDVFLRKKKTSY